MRVQEIYNKIEAIAYGKGRGWCTADCNSPYYDRDYNSKLGRLFVIYKEPKKKPQYQIFFRFGGGIELKAKFNTFVNHNEFLSNEGIELKDWYLKITKSLPQKRASANTDAARRMARQIDGEILSGLRGEQRYHREYDFDYSSIEQRIGRRLHRDVITSRGERLFEFILDADLSVIMSVHHVEEIPMADRVDRGTIISIHDERVILIATIDDRGRPRYIGSRSVEEIRPNARLNPYSRAISSNFRNRDFIRITIEEEEETIHRLCEICNDVQMRNYTVRQERSFEALENFDLSAPINFNGERVPSSGTLNIRRNTILEPHWQY